MLMLPSRGVISQTDGRRPTELGRNQSILHSSLKVASGGFIIYRVMEARSTTPQCVVM